MAQSSLRGQSSGDYKETSGRVQFFHVVTRDSFGALTADAFTQANPPVVTTAGTLSTTLAGITKVGVLGSSIAFTRAAAGNNLYGGPPSGAYLTGICPLGIIINDAIGNAFENTPGIASGIGPYVTGSGSVLGCSLYETQQLTGGGAGTALVYAPGNLLYASANGLLTNAVADAYEVLAGGGQSATVMGVCVCVPDATNNLLVINLRV